MCRRPLFYGAVLPSLRHAGAIANPDAAGKSLRNGGPCPATTPVLTTRNRTPGRSSRATRTRGLERTALTFAALRARQSGRGQRSRSKLCALDGGLAVMLPASRNIAGHSRYVAYGVSCRPTTSGDADAAKRASTADRTSTRSACRSSPHADENEAAVAGLCAGLAAPDAGFGLSDSLSGRHGHQDLGVAVHAPDERSSGGRPRPSRRSAAETW